MTRLKFTKEGYSLEEYVRCDQALQTYRRNLGDRSPTYAADIAFLKAFGVKEIGHGTNKVNIDSKKINHTTLRKTRETAMNEALQYRHNYQEKFETDPTRLRLVKEDLPNRIESTTGPNADRLPPGYINS